MRDLELQRMATASAHARRFDRDENVDPLDEYSGLMTQRERQWIINIQLSQLKCENPFLVRGRPLMTSTKFGHFLTPPPSVMLK